MNLVHESESAASWYVTNGDAVVGPIGTELLLRGVASARITEECLVAQPSWTRWRQLSTIREYARYRRGHTWTHAAKELVNSGVSEDLVKHAPDAGEALLYAMQAAVNATSAVAALVHRAREPFIGLVTSSAYGRGADQELGEVIARRDPAYEHAVSGHVVIGRPADEDATRCVARRFSACGVPLAGVAMVPVFDGATLLAMIELARVDHAFRAADARLLSHIAKVVCAR